MILILWVYGFEEVLGPDNESSSGPDGASSDSIIFRIFMTDSASNLQCSCRPFIQGVTELMGKMSGAYRGNYSNASINFCAMVSISD